MYFNVTNHREAVKNRCSSYKSDSIVLKFYESAYLIIMVGKKMKEQDFFVKFFF